MVKFTKCCVPGCRNAHTKFVVGWRERGFVQGSYCATHLPEVLRRWREQGFIVKGLV